MSIKKISYRKTGGFIGAFRGCDLELDKLSSADQEKLHKLIQDADLINLAGKTQPGACDVYYYTFTSTTSDGKEHEAKFDDVTLPEKVRPLSKFLDGKSTDLKRPR